MTISYSKKVSLYDYLPLSLVPKCILFEATKKELLNSPEMYRHSFMQHLSICVSVTFANRYHKMQGG